MKKRTWTQEYLRDCKGALTALRFQLDGIVDGSANPEMQEAAHWLGRIDAHLDALIREGVDEVCPRCGYALHPEVHPTAAERPWLTHAPWCQLEDGTLVPHENVPTIYALARCKNFIKVIAQSAMGDDHFLWALSDLLNHLAEWVYPLRQPF